MNLAQLETMIGHNFRSPHLLERAVTHRSWAHENLKGRKRSEIRNAENESLEFIGDSVLGLTIAHELFERHPDAAEGELTLMKHRLVSMPSLVVAAEKLDIGRFLKMGRGEASSGGRTKPAILADALEAVIGAIFLDAGYASAQKFVTDIFAEELKCVSPETSIDYKTLLQEKLQSQKLKAPTYHLIGSEGQPHDRTFFVEAVWAGGKAKGSGRTIKAAEMEAANNALELIGTSEAETGAERNS